MASRGNRVALVVGGNGYLGQFAVQRLVASGGLRVHASYCRREPPEKLRSEVPCHRLDTGDAAQVAEVLAQVDPDVVVNCSAMSAVGKCEKDTAGANAANCPRALVRAMAQLGGKRRLFVHCSTDLVFEGDPEAIYTEDAAPAPVNAYGRSKAEFDEFLAGWNGEPQCAVVRLSNILGVDPPYGPCEGMKFLQWLDMRLKLDEPSTIFDDELRNYVWVTDILDVFQKLTLDFLSSPGPPPSLLHVGGPESLSRADLAALVAARRGHPITFRDAAGETKQKIVPTERASVDLGYASPLCVRLSSAQAEAFLGRGMRRIGDAIAAELPRS